MLHCEILTYASSYIIYSVHPGCEAEEGIAFLHQRAADGLLVTDNGMDGGTKAVNSSKSSCHAVIFNPIKHHF